MLNFYLSVYTQPIVVQKQCQQMPGSAKVEYNFLITSKATVPTAEQYKNKKCSKPEHLFTF